ncbi:Uncharacterised protein [Streptococcus constellatus]|uniref:Uncharacterized protein n=1 Tax=Streptococcus constellatus TaxID=76860 RepID=A0A564SPZ9_STRCV|nr:Uncharacterised protein [Streptococcus gordonii]VUW97257.1 Uncharacterised protein [Streptococcus constellatus]
MKRIRPSLVIAAIFIISRFIWFFLTRLNIFFDLAGTIVIAVILFIVSCYLFGKIDRN